MLIREHLKNLRREAGVPNSLRLALILFSITMQYYFFLIVTYKKVNLKTLL